MVGPLDLLRGNVDLMIGSVRLVVVRDVPELLVLGGRALSRARWPNSVADIFLLTSSEVVEMLPVAGVVFSVVLIPLLLSLRRSKNSDSYWLARVLLLRGVALLYLAGFLSAAFQARALFGSLGIQQRRTSGARDDWRGYYFVGNNDK